MGHWPMFSRPEDLAKLLLDLPSGGSFKTMPPVGPNDSLPKLYKTSS
jgi:hypothetical protein